LIWVRIETPPLVQQRQRERGGLAGAGLGEAEHVGPFEGRGNRLELDGPGLGEPRGAHAARQVRVKLEPVEAGCRDRLRSRHIGSDLPRAARSRRARCGCIVPTRTTAVGKKEFCGATWEEVLLFAAAEQECPV
jgi:hypothetical protein